MRTQTITHAISVVFLTLFCHGMSSAQNNIPYRDALREANVTLSEMKNGQHESLILGNGDLYGIVWERNGGVFMRITKNDIWDARVDTSEDVDLPRVDIASGKVTALLIENDLVEGLFCVSID